MRIFIIYEKKGAALLFTFIVMISLISVVGAYLGFVQYSTRSTGAQIEASQAFYLAEAGIQRAVWNLKTPITSGGQGEDWTTSGTTEALGEGSYAMEVARWDFALADNRAFASASSVNKDNVAANAIDGNDATRWQSADSPLPSNPQEIIINFPYTLTINKVRFFLPPTLTNQRPKDYSWQASSDGISYSTILSRNDNNDTDVIDTFTAVSSVNYLKLEITRIGAGEEGVVVATLEAIGSKISSVGTVGEINRELEQTVVTDDATETAYNEIDWQEI